MITRKATPEEFDTIYMMGFDVWSDGVSKEEYLEACRTSPKYKKGSWYVLADGLTLVSSLIIYNLHYKVFGIGSISTPLEVRKRGYASKLISQVLKEFDIHYPESTYFLYSDIETYFYEKFDFIELAATEQIYKTTTCMIRGTNKSIIPEYF